MSLPSLEIVVRNLLAQKSYTTIHREGIQFKKLFWTRVNVYIDIKIIFATLLKMAGKDSHAE